MRMMSSYENGHVTEEGWGDGLGVYVDGDECEKYYEDAEMQYESYEPYEYGEDESMFVHLQRRTRTEPINTSSSDTLPLFLPE